MKTFLYLALMFSSMKLICKATPTDRPLVFENEVKAPNIPPKDFVCGSPNPLAFFYGVLEGRKVPAYHLNTTADNLVSDGFEITVHHLTDDAISEFSASNGTFNVSYSFEGFGGLAAVGGQPASTTRALYMAQLGFRNEDIIEWLCDGVLINRDWILSAAHCFLDSQYVPNLVRLGDYDLNEPEEKNESFFGKFTYDYEMEETIFHPEFQLEERYHDLVLIRIPRKYPKLSARINPICLPWDSLTNQNLVGNHVTLTGWGATHYGGSKTALLQEVVLEVYPTSKCQENYAKVPNFKQRYPKGIDEDAIICVGWKTDGKDACGGDSGAPIVYEPSNSSIVLVGIVSGGFGCGQKEFPGLYIPINKPKYLQWIRDVAFKNYL